MFSKTLQSAKGILHFGTWYAGMLSLLAVSAGIATVYETIDRVNQWV